MSDTSRTPASDKNFLALEKYERSEDRPVPRPMARAFRDIAAARFSRRSFLQGTSSTVLALGVSGALAACSEKEETGIPGFDFDEIAHGVDETHHVAPGHDADILLRWGDPLFADSPPFDPENQSAATQLKQFG